MTHTTDIPGSSTAQVDIPAWRAWLTLIMLSICYVFSLLDRLIISLLVDPLKASLSLSDVQVGLLQGPAFAILYATMGVPLGLLADRANRRNMIAAAVTFWGLCTAASGAVRSFTGIAIARVGVGAGEAALTPAAYSLIGDIFKRERLGLAMGVYTAGGTLGSGVALLIGGGIYRMFEAMPSIQAPLLGDLHAWQATLIAVGVPGMMLGLLVLLLVREPARRRSTNQQQSFREVLAMIRNRGSFYFPAFAAYAASAGILYGFVSWTPTFLARTFSLGPAEIGARFGPVMIVAGLFGPLLAGYMSDRLHPRRGVLAPFAVMSLLFVFIAVAAAFAFRADDFSAALIGCGIVGLLGTGLLGLPALALQLGTAPHLRGQVAGINLMIGNLLGLGLGPLSVAAVSQHVLQTHSLGLALAIVIAVISALGLVASISTRRLVAVSAEGM